MGHFGDLVEREIEFEESRALHCSRLLITFSWSGIGSFGDFYDQGVLALHTRLCIKLDERFSLRKKKKNVFISGQTSESVVCHEQLMKTRQQKGHDHNRCTILGTFMNTTAKT